MPGVQSFRELIGVSPSTASSSDSALVIIDAQEEYASGLLKVSNASSSCAAIASLLKKYRAAKGAIVHIYHETPEGAPVFTPRKAVSGPMRGLEAEAGEKVIWKKHPGSYAGTDLQEWLDGEGVKKVVLVGYMAHVCVSTTARQASELGYDVVLVEDGIGDRDIPGISGDEVSKTVLLELADAFGSVVRSDEIK
ncbi:hypothetical protein MMC34_001900 [Xylographa carneopallida]|nr:hypothetical protein [Xylographa carneopallida]